MSGRGKTAHKSFAVSGVLFLQAVFQAVGHGLDSRIPHQVVDL